MKIDTTYNFQKDWGEKDADKFSKILQEYHQSLWSKPLPNGQIFNLEKASQNRLHHNSDLGNFYLSSDRAVATYDKRKRGNTASIVKLLPEGQLDSFLNIAETIGSIMIWPSQTINGQRTINADRGMNVKIADRLDLTIECIRRYYIGEESPLYDTFCRYKYFFDLFVNFKGYIDFFLLQDFVNQDYKSVKITIPFDSFATSSTPKNIEEYTQYMNDTTKLINERNKRIDEYAKANI